jgi:hypothetical protein
MLALDAAAAAVQAVDPAQIPVGRRVGGPAKPGGHEEEEE